MSSTLIAGCAYWCLPGAQNVGLRLIPAGL